MKLRLLEQNDVKAVSQIVRKNYSAKEVKLLLKELHDMFRNPELCPQYVVVEQKGTTVAFAGYKESSMDYGVYTIFWVNVCPLHQGKGIGSALIKKIIAMIKRKKGKLILISTSKPKFYSKKFGFKTITTFQQNRRHYLMCLKLKPSILPIDIVNGG